MHSKIGGCKVFGFIAGLFVGGFIGVFIMAVVSVGNREDDE